MASSYTNVRKVPDVRLESTFHSNEPEDDSVVPC